MNSPTVLFIRLDRQEKALHIGRLAEKYFNSGQGVQIIVSDEEMAAALDRYLWTWKKGSFLPHTVQQKVGETCEETIVISTLEHRFISAEILICAAPCSPSFFQDFQVVYDFAETYDAQLADDARKRFRHYRQLGFDPQMDASQPAPDQEKH